MTLTPEQIEKNFQKLLDIISNKISGDRGESLMNLHLSLILRIATAPASTKASYHNAFPGGYVLHVLNVVKAAEKIHAVWSDMGATIDFTLEELYMSVICHDLGKIGSMTEDYYIPCEEAWLQKKGQIYVTNPALQYMKAAERSLFLLQENGIILSEKEYLTIKLHDGLYEEGNKSYYMSYNEDYELKTVLPFIVHQADLLCSKTEKHVTLEAPKAANRIESKPSFPIKTAPTKTGNKTLDKFLNQ